MMALPKGEVLTTTLACRHYVFLGERLNSIHLFDQLPSPDGLHLPRPFYRSRQYTDWQLLSTVQPVAMPSDDVDTGQVIQENRPETKAESAEEPAADAATGSTAAQDKPDTDTKPDDGKPSGAAKLMG
jgi:hypothetical protein